MRAGAEPDHQRQGSAPDNPPFRRAHAKLRLSAEGILPGTADHPPAWRAAVRRPRSRPSPFRPSAESEAAFPILIKLIDARSALSVQVHPDDSYALEHEGEYGKTEMWYILDCEENASLYYGFKKDVTKEEYKNAIENNTLTDILNKIPVHKGDVFFIPAGTVHAIGAGILICEIQQNSNTTYRVYDYNRRDKKGNTRPLHVEKAIAVSNLSKAPEIQQESDESNAILAQCEYFTVREITVADTASIDLDTTSFRSLIVTEGSAKLEINHETLSLEKGNSIFVPAQSGRLNIYGNCTLIMSQV